MNEYYNEIEHLIRKNEINKKSRILQNNSDTLETYWNIGKLIVEAQGGKTRAKYGNALIKEWSKKLNKLYGNNYSDRNLRYMRQFYNTFQIWQPVVSKLTWSHYIQLFPIKDENKKNYYINLCIQENLSKRELIEKIKNISYKRLMNIPEKIEIITKEKDYNIKEYIKNPIIIKLSNKEKILKEKDLQTAI